MKEINEKTWFYLCVITGILGILFYTLSTLGSFPFKVSYLMFMHTGIFISLSISFLYRITIKSITNFPYQLGMLFLFCSGIVHSIMACMQGSNRAWFNRQGEEVDREILIGIFSSQLGVDFTFDMLISFGLFFLCLGLLLAGKLHKSITISGMIVSIGGYSVNALSFPSNPGNSGWVDPGPFFSLWFFVFVVALIRDFYKTHKFQDNEL